MLTYGWAYGSKSGYKVGRKRVTLAVSTSIDIREYAHDEKYKYTLNSVKKRKYHRDSTMPKTEVTLIIILFYDSGYHCYSWNFQLF